MNVNIPALLTSKKFLVAMLTAIVTFIGQMRGMSTTDLLELTAPFYAFIGAQSIADLGKEKAKVEAKEGTAASGSGSGS